MRWLLCSRCAGLPGPHIKCSVPCIMCRTVLGLCAARQNVYALCVGRVYIHTLLYMSVDAVLAMCCVPKPHMIMFCTAHSMSHYVKCMWRVKIYVLCVGRVTLSFSYEGVRTARVQFDFHQMLTAVASPSIVLCKSPRGF